MSEVGALFVDLNSYFASVEQEVRHELRGKPVGVVAVETDHTCCIAASYEAKAFGISTGTMVRDAKRLCPEILIVQARPPLYLEYHDKIVAAVDTVAPVSEVMSIDEMVCDLGGTRRNPDRARDLAIQIKEAIRTGAGSTLRCSIGIAPNRYLSKLASDMQKPDGLVVILPEEIPQRLFPLDLRDFKGIGPRMVKHFHAAGIFSVEQMYALSRRELRTIWGGVQGERWYYHIRGEVIPSEKSQRGSFGNSHVLDPEHRSVRKALPVLERLLMKAAARLRTHGFRSGRLTVFVRHRYERQAYVWQAEAHFAPISDTISAIQALKKIWSGRPNGLVPYAVGVTFTDLVTEANHTPSLFDRDDKRLALSRAMDKVNGAFGKNKVYIGGASDALETTPVRIAFRNIPDMGVENLM